MKTTILIRDERPADIPAVRSVYKQAFGRLQEAKLAERLLMSCNTVESLVAEDKGRIVGHIMFSPVTIDSWCGTVEGMGLAPVAVLPEYQKQGVGSRLVNQGLSILRAKSCPFVVVLGHPDYYPRFGFEPASWHGMKSQWDDVPDDAFFVIIMDRKAMEGVSGTVKYRDEFSGGV
ncbi:MAG TPA: N-acetyltransferase [Deltaproteobacteria bacterium]|jgi:putative acetyltransferase|nr:N-acetyltransferase [Deltaproteobacteria bacterium]HQI02474.1 N-acetyltransferase [Deltaproteobacteria bacterium]HQJ09928.1 N-acetyltransferase [Deltaproteobacteria bacterium]